MHALCALQRRHTELKCCAQGAFRKVAVEAAACAKELTATLKKRMLLHKEEAAECIQMLRKLGEPVEALQVGAKPLRPIDVGIRAESQVAPGEPQSFSQTPPEIRL